MTPEQPAEFGDIERAEFEAHHSNHTHHAMTTDHPQHSTNHRPVTHMTRDDFIVTCVEGLQSLAARHSGVLTPPNHRAVLSAAARTAKPFAVRPAPMPTGNEAA